MPPGAGMLLMPAAGLATRIGGLPKFALPIGPAAAPLIRLHAEAASSIGLRVVVATRPEWETLVDRVLSGINATVVMLETSTGSETILQCLDQLPTSPFVAVSLPDTWISTLQADLAALCAAHGEPEESETVAPVIAVTYQTPVTHQGLLGTCVIRDGYITAVHDKQYVQGANQHWGVIGASAEIWRTKLLPGAPHAGFVLNSVLAEGHPVKCFESSGLYLDCGTIFGYEQALSASLSNA